MLKETRSFLTLLAALMLAASAAPAPPPAGRSSGAALYARKADRDSLNLRVSFMGGNVSDNAVKVLLVLHRVEPLKLESHWMKEGESVVGVYADHLDLPAPTPLALDLAGEINRRDYRKQPPAVGEEVLYPDIELDDLEVTASYNLVVESDRAELEKVKQAWSGHIGKQEVREGKVILELRAFALEVPRGSGERLNRSIDEVSLLKDASVRVESSRVAVEPPDNTFGVRLQGHDVISRAEELLKTLLKLGALKTTRRVVRPGDTLDSIYSEQLDISGSFSRLAVAINRAAEPSFEPNRLRVGDEVLVPDVKFRTFRWKRRIFTGTPEGQRELAALQSPAWKHLLPTLIPTASPDTVFVSLLGYELSMGVESRDKLEAVYKSLSAIKSSDVRLSFPSLEARRMVTYSAEEARPGNLFWVECCDNMRRGDQGYIGSFIGLTIEDAVRAAGRCAGNNCPQIVLIDRNIKPHPDVAEALIDEKGTPLRARPLIDENNNRQTISKGTYSEDADHGTHMAGIIASRDNEFGLIGVNPYAKLYPFELERTKDHFAFYDLINDRVTGGPPQIYVFTSQWSASSKTDDKQGRDRSELIRSDAKPLFIAAAGHNESGPLGVSIDKGSTDAPMNLGLEPNVIIVTGCFTCAVKSGQQSQLDPRANYSEGADKLVHIAAPMQTIPSTLSGGGYGEIGGTSQATALVAGVASLMASSFPTYYANSPWKMKFRLIVTSLPELSDVDSRRLAGGVLNPTDALRDPDLHYLAGNDRKLAEFTPRHWCQPDIKLRAANSGSFKSIPVKQIYRIYKTQDQEWVIYYSEQPFKANVQKAGPGLILGQDDLMLLAKQDGQVVDLNDFTDILLSKGLAATGPCVRPQ